MLTALHQNISIQFVVKYTFIFEILFSCKEKMSKAVVGTVVASDARGPNYYKYTFKI